MMPPGREALPSTAARSSLLAWLVLGSCVLGLSALIAWIGVRDQLGDHPDSSAPSPITGPGQVTMPEQLLAEHRRAMEEELGGYGWVDRERGLARIPIREGMARVLEQGLPARDEPAPEPSEER